MKKILNYSKPYLRKNTKMTTCGCVDGSAASGSLTSDNSELCNSGASVVTPVGPGKSYCTIGGTPNEDSVYCYSGSGASTYAGCKSGSQNTADIMTFDACTTGSTISATSTCETGSGAS
jgi:hypothetical protein